MKVLRITWYMLTAALLIAGLFTGTREFFLMFFVFLFVILYALALNLWTAFSFSFVQELTVPATVKGGTPELKIGIYNDKPFPFTQIKILVETVVSDKTYELAFSLSPKSNIDFTIPIECPYRGVYDVGMTIIEINDIFGLVKTRLDLRRLSYYRQQQIKILPRLVLLPYLPAHDADAKYSGVSAMRLSEDGDSYSDLRRYRHGDSFKRIHKPISARRRELYVKNYDIPMENAVLVAIDNAMDIGVGEPARYLVDTACECFVALAVKSLQHGYTVETAGIDLHRPFKQHNRWDDLTALYHTVAEFPFDGSGNGNGSGNLGRTLELVAEKIEGLHTAYVISTSEPEAYVAEIRRLQQKGSHVCFLNISHEKEIQEKPESIPGITYIRVTPEDDIQSVLTGDKE